MIAIDKATALDKASIIYERCCRTNPNVRTQQRLYEKLAKLRAKHPGIEPNWEAAELWWNSRPARGPGVDW